MQLPVPAQRPENEQPKRSTVRTWLAIPLLVLLRWVSAKLWTAYLVSIRATIGVIKWSGYNG